MKKKLAFSSLSILLFIVVFLFSQKTNTVTDRLDTDYSCAYAYLTAEDTTQISTADNYYRINGVFNNEILKNFAIVSDTLTYTGDVPIYFEVIVSASLSTSVVNTTASLALYKNGILQINSVMQTKLNLTTDTQNLSIVDVLYLVNGDKVSIVLSADKTTILTTKTINTSIKRFCI